MNFKRLLKTFILLFSIFLVSANISAKSWTFTIQGKITNSSNNDISAAYIDIETKQGSFKSRTQVNSDGTFKFENVTLFDDEVNLIVYKDYYHKEIRTITLNNNDITLAPIDLKPNVLEFKFHIKNKDLDSYHYNLFLLDSKNSKRLIEVKNPGESLHLKINEADIGGFSSTIFLVGQAQGYYIYEGFDKPLSANFKHEDYFIEKTVEFKKAPYNVSGNYIDENEQPIKNVEVYLKDYNGKTLKNTTSDSNGNYSFKDLGIHAYYQIVSNKMYYKQSALTCIKTNTDQKPLIFNNKKLTPVKTTINLSFNDDVKDLETFHVKLLNNHSTLIELDKNSLNKSITLNTKDIDTNLDGMIDSNIKLTGSLDGYELHNTFNRKISSKTEDNTINIPVKFTKGNEEIKEEPEVIEETDEDKEKSEVTNDDKPVNTEDKETNKVHHKQSDKTGFNLWFIAGIGITVIFFFIIILWKRKKDEEEEENEKSEN